MSDETTRAVPTDADLARMRAEAEACEFLSDPSGRISADVLALLAEVDRLRAGIRAHRDAEGDDRCWLDDLALYDLLPEGSGRHTGALPPREEFLESCRRFWEQRCGIACKERAVTKGMTIAQLEAEVGRLRARVAELEGEKRDRALDELQRLGQEIGEVSHWMPLPPPPDAPGRSTDAP